MYILDFEVLHSRVVQHLQDIVRNGVVTERGLSRMTGLSQPHIHQVLKGTKFLSMASANHVLRSLQTDLVDFLEPEDIEEWRKRGANVVE
ncbi:MAG TPA: XRE family transcriptional regulator [Verrucomicrobiae bacterium]|nr:XRE family transcriptional regulator [Verrucomicrobiae bacterium]